MNENLMFKMWSLIGEFLPVFYLLPPELEWEPPELCEEDPE